ncbi:MAG: hypothetical protein V2A72_00325 [Candidatus Omnitrophota bacterium]
MFNKLRNALSKTIFIGLIIAAALSFVFHVRLQQETAELRSLKDRIEFVKAQIAESEGKVAAIENENKLLKQQIDESETKIVFFNSQLSETKGKKAELIALLENRHAELEQIKEKLKTLTGEKETLKIRQEQILSRRDQVNAESAKLMQYKEKLEQDIKSYVKPAKGVELEKIVVKLSKASDGSIVDLSRKYGFAIINIGSNDGIIVGDILGVYRRDKFISKVVVEKVFTDMSSVVPAEGYSDMDLAVSDKVSLLK